jgi:hypothetical protein
VSERRVTVDDFNRIAEPVVQEATRVDIASLDELLDETVAFVRRFVVFRSVHSDAVALWNAHTYGSEYASATPYLYAFSPEAGSGKTTLLEVLSVTAANAIPADNLTEAALFRLVHVLKPTLLIDELDTTFGKGAEATSGIRQVLNSGYRKGKKAYRCVPPGHEVVGFDVYCPKAMAGLTQLPATLAHRSIPIELKPPRPGDAYEDFDYEEAVVDAEPLTAGLRAWASEAEDALRDPRRKPAKLPQLDARGNEIWRILFRIADLAGRDWPDRARHAAIELSGTASRQTDASAGVQLLAHIRELFEHDRMTIGGLCDSLNSSELLPYGGWNDGKGITTRELGRKLTPYAITAKSIRVGGTRAGNGYDRDQFEDAWSRYLRDPDHANRYTGTTRTTEPNLADSEPVQAELVPVSQTGAKRDEQNDVPVGPVSHPNQAGADHHPRGDRHQRIAAPFDLDEDELERYAAGLRPAAGHASTPPHQEKS